MSSLGSLFFVQLLGVIIILYQAFLNVMCLINFCIRLFKLNLRTAMLSTYRGQGPCQAFFTAFCSASTFKEKDDDIHKSLFQLLMTSHVRSVLRDVA